MKKLFICGYIMLTILSCQKKNEDPKNNENTENSVNDATADNEIPKNECYIEVTQSKSDPAIRDTISLTVNFDGDKVSGNYNWLPYEKDKKTGTYEGQIKDSIVNAVYTYNAEGQTQKEELIFKLENNKALIKFGELTEINGVWKLKDSTKAQFNTTLIKSQCK